MVGHAAICNYIHETTDAKIGGMLAYSEVYPATCHPKDILVARKWDEFMNFTLLDAYVKGEYSSEMMKCIENHHINMNVLPGEMEEIKNMFDSGVTVWHNPNTIYDYNQNNGII